MNEADEHSTNRMTTLAVYTSATTHELLDWRKRLRERLPGDRPAIAEIIQISLSTIGAELAMRIDWLSEPTRSARSLRLPSVSPTPVPWREREIPSSGPAPGKHDRRATDRLPH